MHSGRKPLSLPVAAWLLSCFLATAPAPCLAKDVLIAWDGMDGIAAGYKVYWGQASRVYEASVDAGSRTEFIVRGLQDGITYYFAATAYDANSNESDFSPEAVLFPSTAASASAHPGARCFIATAAYGSSFAPEVQALREFRDAHLMTNSAGRLLVSAYYSISPPIADFIKESNFLKALARWLLAPLVYAIKNPLTALLIFSLTAAGAALSGRIARPERAAGSDQRSKPRGHF